MERLGAKIDFECGKIFTVIDRGTHVNRLSSTGHVALTVFPKGETERSQLKKKEAWHLDEQLSASPRNEIARPQDKCWIRKVLLISRGAGKIIVGRLESDRKSNQTPLVCVESAQIPTSGPRTGVSRTKMQRILQRGFTRHL